MSNQISNNINDALFNLYLEADKETVMDWLKDDISDLEEYNKKKKQTIFLAKARVKKQHNAQLLELTHKFQDALQRNIKKPIAILKQLIQENASLALYRNLDKLSKEDIIEIIKDRNFVELLEQLEENDKSH